MLATNPKVSRLAAVGRFYVPLSQAQQNELVTAISTIDKLDGLPSWMSEYFAQVEQMFEQDKSDAIQKHGNHDQSTHGNRRSGVSSTVVSDTQRFTADWGGLSINMVDGSMPTASRTNVRTR